MFIDDKFGFRSQQILIVVYVIKAFVFVNTWGMQFTNTLFVLFSFHT